MSTKGVTLMPVIGALGLFCAKPATLARRRVGHLAFDHVALGIGRGLDRRALGARFAHGAQMGEQHVPERLRVGQRGAHPLGNS